MEITSPIGTSSAPPEGSTPPASDTPFEIHGLKLRLPRWAAYAVGIILTLGTVIPVFSQVILPMLKGYTATGQIEKLKAEAEKARAFKEYQIHFSETPRSTQTIFDTADLGSLNVAFYTSDGCLLVKRKGPGQNQAEMSYWVAAKSVPREAPPSAPDDEKESRLEPPPQTQPSLNATYQLASFNLASAPPAPAGMGGCADTHPGQFQTWNGQQNGCWIQVWRRWPDGCQHYQWYNTCNGYWDNQPNGSPKVSWTNCVH